MTVLEMRAYEVAKYRDVAGNFARIGFEDSIGTIRDNRREYEDSKAKSAVFSLGMPSNVHSLVGVVGEEELFADPKSYIGCAFVKDTYFEPGGGRIFVYSVGKDLGGDRWKFDMAVGNYGLPDDYKPLSDFDLDLSPVEEMIELAFIDLEFGKLE